MKKLLPLLAVLSLFVASGIARADNIPNLIGIWTGQYTVFLPIGYGHAKMSLAITGQNGEGFKGHVNWKRTDFTPYPDTTTAEAAKYKVIYNRTKISGVVDFDGRTITIVDTAGVMHATLTGKNTMRVTFMKANPPVAFRATLTRVAGQ